MKAIGMMCFAATLIANSPEIEVIRMEKAPYSEKAVIHQMYTENKSGKLGGRENPLVMQVIDFPVGVFLPSKPEWLRGMRENEQGSVILVWVYGANGYQKRFYLTRQNGTPFVEGRTYFKDTFRKYFESGDLPSGEAVVSANLVNAYGESVKTFKATRTIVANASEKNSTLEQGLKKPHLVYNEPYGNFRNGQPIMLDFYVCNADLGRDAYRVELYIDGNHEETLYEWTPYKIRGLKPGRHEIQLVLLDPSGKKMSEPFGEQKNVILIDN